MVSTAAMPGVDDLPITTGADAHRAIERMQESVASMEEQRLQFIAEGRDQPRPPAYLGVPADGVTRFRSSVRMTWIELRLPAEFGDVDKNVRARKSFEQWAARDEHLGGLGSKWKSIVATDEKILKKYGERRLMFRELPERHESVYETSDPLVINYIRERMQEPGMAHITEEAKPLMMKLPDGTEIPVVPLTQEGQQAVNAQLGG